MSFDWSSHYRWADFLRDRIDRTRCHQVEGRAPFLDPAVTNFGLPCGRPQSPKRTGKYILRKIAESVATITRRCQARLGGGNTHASDKICASCAQARSFPPTAIAYA